MRIVQEMTPEDLSHMEIDLVPFKEKIMTCPQMQLRC